jgi:ERCC4-related helicase
MNSITDTGADGIVVMPGVVVTDPRRFIEQDKKIIISTVQKIPFILVEIATEGGKTFVIVIDEALPRDAEG